MAQNALISNVGQVQTNQALLSNPQQAQKVGPNNPVYGPTPLAPTNTPNLVTPVYGPFQNPQPNTAGGAGLAGIVKSLNQQSQEAYSQLPSPQPYTPSYGSVLGTSTTATGGGSSGGGGYLSTAAPNVQNLADQQKSLIDQQKQALLEGINARYGDTQTSLADMERLLRERIGSSQGQVQSQYGLTADQLMGEAGQAKSRLEQASRLGRREARQNYSDAELQARRRARATGAGSSSGYLEMTSKLDQQFNQQLQGIQSNEQQQGADIDLQVNNRLALARQSADQALQSLQQSLNEEISKIDEDRRTSQREKDQAIKEAELAAMEEGLKVDQWLNDKLTQISAIRASSSSGSRKEAQAQTANNILSAYYKDLNDAASGAINASPDEIQRTYQQIALNQGVGLDALQPVDEVFFGPTYSPNEQLALAQLGNYGISQDYTRAKQLYDMGFVNEAEQLLGLSQQ